MSTTAMRDAIVSELQGHVALSALIRKVVTHEGKWDEAALRRWGNQTPCLVVAWLGQGRVQHMSGLAQTEDRWAIFLFTKHQGGQQADQRDRLAMRILDELSLLIVNQRWGNAADNKPVNIQRMNLHSQAFEKLGVAVAAIGWEQLHHIEGITAAELDDFVTHHIDWVKDREDGEPEPPSGTDATDEVTFS